MSLDIEPIGYYVPYENRTEENDWYGKDMELTEEQAKQLADFVSENQPYNARDVECMVARALLDPEAYPGADGGGRMGGMNNARRTTYDLH